MAARTSELIVRLIDGVTAPARAAARGLLGIPKAARQANGQMTSFTQRIDRAIEANNAALSTMRGRMVDAVAGVFALKGGFDATAGAAMSLEEKMADIAKVSDMSDAQLAAFEKTLRSLARSEIPMAVEQLTELAAAASQSGIADADLEEFTRMVAKASVAWEMTGEASGEALAKIKTALGLTIEETRRYADVINYLADSSASSAPDLIEFSRRVAADGKIAGFANEEVLALGSAMISAGAQADVAATSLRNVGKMLTRGDFGAKKGQLAAFGELGLDAEKVAKAMTVDASSTLLTVLEAISKSPAHKQLALMSGVFGDEARALMPLLGQLDSTRAAIEAVADETNYLGSVQKEFETRSKTGRYALQRFKNQLRDVAIVIGKALLPGMKLLLETISPYLIAISDMAARHPKLVAGLAAAAAGFVALRVAMTGLAYAGLLGRGGVLSALAVGARAVGGSAGHLMRAARASVALQAALGAMAGGQTLSTFQKIATGARGMLFAVPGVAALGSAISAIGAAVATISAPVWGAFAVVAAAVAAAGYMVWKYWDRITAVLSGVGQAIAEILAPAIEKVRPALDWLAPIGETISAAMGKAKDAIAAAGAAISEWLGSFFQREILTDADKEGARKAGYDFVMALWDGMKSIMDSVTGWVSDKASALLAPFSSLPGKIRAAASWVTGGGGEAAPAGVDGARAKGGPISAGRSYLVGEEGPEVVTPNKSGYVHPNGAAPAGGGTEVNFAPVFHFNGMTAADAAAIKREVIQALDRTARSMFSGVYADAGVRTSG